MIDMIDWIGRFAEWHWNDARSAKTIAIISATSESAVSFLSGVRTTKCCMQCEITRLAFLWNTEWQRITCSLPVIICDYLCGFVAAVESW